MYGTLPPSPGGYERERQTHARSLAWRAVDREVTARSGGAFGHRAQADVPGPVKSDIEPPAVVHYLQPDAALGVKAGAQPDPRGVGVTHRVVDGLLRDAVELLLHAGIERQRFLGKLHVQRHAVARRHRRRML